MGSIGHSLRSNLSGSLSLLFLSAALCQLKLPVVNLWSSAVLCGLIYWQPLTSYFRGGRSVADREAGLNGVQAWPLRDKEMAKQENNPEGQAVLHESTWERTGDPSQFSMVLPHFNMCSLRSIHPSQGRIRPVSRHGSGPWVNCGEWSHED